MKIFFNKLLKYLPNNGEMLKNIYYRLTFEKRRLSLNKRLFFGKYNIPDPDKIYWIDPKKIKYHTNLFKTAKTAPKDRVFDMIKDKSRIYGGDWDSSSIKFTSLDVYKAFKQRIKDGAEWQETIFYKKVLKDIEVGKKNWRCRNQQDWDKHCLYLDSLIESIKINGFIPAYQLMEKKGLAAKFLRKEMSEEITVNVGRNGQLLFQNGRHRLAIALILGIKKIPVRVIVCHKEYAEKWRKK